MPDPATTYPEFYSNPAIASIAPKPFWTYSDADKRPVDLFELRVRHRIAGANPLVPHSLDTLDGLLALLPDVPNHAYKLDAVRDGIICIDIEKTASDETRESFLALPWLYAETSLSGKGLHLFMPLPANFDDFPVAAAKTVMKSDDGTYELLLDHWVTFTRNAIARDRPPEADWESAWAAIASKARVMTRLDIEVEESRPDMPAFIAESIERDVVARFLDRSDPKTPADYGGDMSRYEFATICSLRNRLMAHLRRLGNTAAWKGLIPNESACAWLLYDMASRPDVLDWRDKHEQTRDGLPWLLYLAREAIAKYDGGEE